MSAFHAAAHNKTIPIIASKSKEPYAPFLTDPRDFVIIVALAILGHWLEQLNGKHGWVDELLAPIPLALAGCLVLIGEQFG